MTRRDREGRQIFVDVLTQFAEQSRNSRLTPIIRRLAVPVRVAVVGRDGVGSSTVRTALAGAGVAVESGVGADVTVTVVAESLKPEELASIGAADGPTVIVVNKADLSGFGTGGPVAAAHRFADRCRALTGLPAVPMVGLLAVADLDDELLGALQLLVHTPADLSSTDAFIACPHPVPTDVRRRLLATLDRFGIAHAVRALGDGADVAELRSVLRRESMVDAVVAQVRSAGAQVRYRRVCRARAELRSLSVQFDDDDLDALLVDEDVVLAAMAAAVDVVEADGAWVDATDDRHAHLRRAVHWDRYARGPVGELHRGCASDIRRGSLRLAGRSR